jgi:ABC-2 type transport system ATP-binding protein
LTAEPAVLSIAQLGSRLHVLMQRSLEEPERHVRQALAGRCETAAIERVGATLEDVFVAATVLRDAPGEGGERAA